MRGTPFVVFVNEKHPDSWKMNRSILFQTAGTYINKIL